MLISGWGCISLFFPAFFSGFFAYFSKCLQNEHFFTFFFAFFLRLFSVFFQLIFCFSDIFFVVYPISCVPFFSQIVFCTFPPRKFSIFLKLIISSYNFVNLVTFLHVFGCCFFCILVIFAPFPSGFGTCLRVFPKNVCLWFFSKSRIFAYFFPSFVHFCTFFWPGHFPPL